MVLGAMTRPSPDYPGAWGRYFFVVIAFLLVSVACTSTPPERSPPIPAIKSVAIISKGPTRELQARFGVAPENRVAGKAAAVGTGAGALAGLGWAAVCGPYFFFCALAVAPTTALAGGAAGGLAGTASDIHKTPPDEQMFALDRQFREIYQQRTLHMDIRDSLENQLPADRLAEPATADALVELNLSDIRFTRTFSNKYQWTLKSVMVVTWNRDRDQPRHSYKIYDFASSALPLDDWLENDGEMLNRGLDESVAGLTRQMATDLRIKD